jgi:hypothetical protein
MFVETETVLNNLPILAQNNQLKKIVIANYVSRFPFRLSSSSRTTDTHWPRLPNFLPKREETCTPDHRSVYAHFRMPPAISNFQTSNRFWRSLVRILYAWMISHFNSTSSNNNMGDAQNCEVSVNSKAIYSCTLKQYVVTDITSFVKVTFYRT